MKKEYTRNHYVPEWYQKRFIPAECESRSLYYLQLKPTFSSSNGHKYKNKQINHWGVKKCFYEKDLYTTKFDGLTLTDIERYFFGEVDRLGVGAVEYFADFDHRSADQDAFHNLLRYMSIQRLRTPKGLGYLSLKTKITDKNSLLIELQKLQNIFCAIWAECQWSLVDAAQSDTKFIVTDHPVTTYNKGCYPLSKYCRNFNDPDIRSIGTHTLYPLNQNKMLILTNKSWFHNPYANPLRLRPNPVYFRDTFFNFMDIQVGRQLAEEEVCEINYILKMRAHTHIAAANEEWLFPEKRIEKNRWDGYGKKYLLMPDPRSSFISSGPVISYQGGGVEAFDIYGRKPGQAGYEDEALLKKEQKTFESFKGEYARMYGPIRRGVSGQFGGERLKMVDSPEYHAYHVNLPKHKKS